MQINVLLFAAAKEAANSDQLKLSFNTPPSAAELLEQIGCELPSLQSLLPSCRLAVNSCYVDGEHTIEPTDEIALIPPVSGG